MGTEKLVLALLILPIAFSLQINEVMYNPEGSDTDREWIELYNNDSFSYNLTGWKLNTDNTNHTLNVPPAKDGRGSMIIGPSEYVIIAQNATFFTNNYTFPGTVIDSSWTGLSNSANEIIMINDGKNVIDSIVYFAEQNATEGHTTCFVNDSFYECLPTPGVENILYIPQQNNTNNTVFNETNSTNGNQTNVISCNMNIDIQTNSSSYNFGDTIDFDIFVNDTQCNATAHNMSVEYYVRDIFGNVVKPLLNFSDEITCTSTKSRQWTPSNDAESAVYYIMANITDTGCNDTDISDNIIDKMIAVRGTVQTKQESAINITSIGTGSDNSVKFGETVMVGMEIYRGNTSKYAIDVWIESGGKKASSVSTIHADTKFNYFKFDVPVALKTNCDGALADGTYTIISEGLDVTTSKDVAIKGIVSSNCKAVSPNPAPNANGGGGGGTIPVTQPKPLLYFNITNYSKAVNVGEDFVTSVKIVNNLSTTKNISIYSYVFKGNNPVSLGLAANGTWRATYTANARNIILKSLTSSIVELKNMIENATEPGVYSLRVRIKYDSTENDITYDVIVNPENNTITKNKITSTLKVNTTKTPENKTINSTTSKAKITTGNAITGTKTSKNSTRLPDNLLTTPIWVLLRMVFGL